MSSCLPPHTFSFRLFPPLPFDRAVGIPPYNDVREGYGLLPVTSFEGITSDATVQGLLEGSYGGVDLLDAYTGALAESLDGSGAPVGPLLQVRETQAGRG